MKFGGNLASGVFVVVFFVVVFFWCFCGGVFLWLCFCGGVFFCDGVFVVSPCFLPVFSVCEKCCGNVVVVVVVVFWRCFFGDGVFAAVFFLRWCFCFCSLFFSPSMSMLYIADFKLPWLFGPQQDDVPMAISPCKGWKICLYLLSLLFVVTSEGMYFPMFSCYLVLLIVPACFSVSSRLAVHVLVHVLIRRVST